MAVISYALTTKEFLSGKKTCTRRDWEEKHFERWCKWWDEGKRIHQAWDKVPFAGGKQIGWFEMTCRPYKERLGDMPVADLEAEGGMVDTIEDFCKLIGKTKDDIVVVIRFKKIIHFEFNQKGTP